MKRKKRTVVQIFARDFQAPPRIVQMCRDLSKQKFNVYRLLFRKKKTDKKYDENFKTISVKKIGTLSDKPANDISLLDLIEFGIFGAKKLKNINKKTKINIIHCHRHSALIPAIFSKILGVKAKIVLDYHDPWSGESTISEGESIGLINKIKIKLFHFLEKILLRYVSHIVVVSTFQKELIKKTYGLEDESFTIVSNSAATADKNLFDPARKDKNKFGWKNKKIILFTGCIVSYFGVDLLIDAIPLVLKKVPNALFIIKIAEEIKEKEYYQELLDKIKGYKIQKNIQFIKEWMSEEKYSQFVCSADLGIICHQPTLLTKTADPDKLYEYLAAGLPIVATNLEIMKKYVKEKKNGFIVDNNSKDISGAIIKILSNTRLKKKMGKNSRTMRYYWEDDFKKLLNTYNKLLKHG